MPRQPHFTLTLPAGKKEDNNVLSPERVVEMLAAAAGEGVRLELVHCHRCGLAGGAGQLRTG